MPPTSTPKRRAPLTRERILRAALTLVDRDGIEALTMRKLGETLGYEAMSLYNHVANKDDVIDGILDLILADTDPPSPAGAWDTAIRTSAISVHAALQAHPWAAGLLLSPDRVPLARLRYMDSLLRTLREGGFSAEKTYHAYHVLHGFIFGFSLWETSHTFTEEQAARLGETFAQVITPEAHPYLHEHGQQHFTDGPHREESAFELGLDLIIDGLKRRLPASQRRSARTT